MDYVAVLRKLAQDCNYEEKLPEMLRHRLVGEKKGSKGSEEQRTKSAHKQKRNGQKKPHFLVEQKTQNDINTQQLSGKVSVLGQIIHLLFSVFPQTKPELRDIISIYYHEDAFKTHVSMMVLSQQTKLSLSGCSFLLSSFLNDHVFNFYRRPTCSSTV